MKINSRTKGQEGEREFCKWLEINMGLKGITRNLDQVREGGADILQVPGLAIEVKRQECINKKCWWEQAVKQALHTHRMPVVAYRQNRKKWKFCLPASLIIDGSWGFITLEEKEFKMWLKNYLEKNNF